MKSKTIKKFLEQKVNKWLSTIEDPSVKDIAATNTIITGGSIASLLLNEPAKDYDIYFRNKETALAVANYYVNKFNEANPKYKANTFVLDCDDRQALEKEGRNAGHMLNTEPGRVKIVVRSSGVASEDDSHLTEPFEDVYDVLDSADGTNFNDLEKLDGSEAKYRPIFLSSNAITLSDKIQLVIRFYGEPNQIHENYDFAHCMNYYDHGKRLLFLNPEAMECLLTKELRYKGSKYPLCSIIRSRKFIQRGFSINAGQYLKMCIQLNRLDLTDIKVLEDQLTGVDSAYFGIIIRSLQGKIAENPNYKIEDSYIATVIDRIF